MVRTGASGKSFPGWDDIDEDVLPEMTETYDLGSADKRWAWLFVAFAIVSSLTIGGVIKLSAVEGELFVNASSTINGSLTVNENITAVNISADYFFGNGSHLSSVNYSESDPFWTGNRSNYVNISRLLGFDYYNSTDFDISNFMLNSTLLGYDYYNISDFDINDYLLESNRSLAGNYSATIDFCIAGGNCLSAAGAGAAGNPFNQSLNTTDNVTFYTLNVTGDSIRIGDSNTNHSIYFYNAGSPKDQVIKWSNTLSRFEFSDNVYFSMPPILGTVGAVVYYANGFSFKALTDNYVMFGANGSTDDMVIAPNHNVGIHTLTPQNTLNVNGSINITEDTWCNQTDCYNISDFTLDTDTKNANQTNSSFNLGLIPGVVSWNGMPTIYEANISDFGTYRTETNNTFTSNVTLNDELVMSQDKGLFMGSGTIYYNGTCTIIKGSSAEMQIC